jgi:ABC-type multidrug transport system fused ATPase/permease subunit
MLKNADNIVVLHRGKVIGYGSHDHLLQDCGLYEKLWKQQMEM